MHAQAERIVPVETRLYEEHVSHPIPVYWDDFVTSNWASVPKAKSAEGRKNLRLVNGAELLLERPWPKKIADHWAFRMPRPSRMLAHESKSRVGRLMSCFPAMRSR